jgi:hypothetical protein
MQLVLAIGAGIVILAALPLWDRFESRTFLYRDRSRASY